MESVRDFYYAECMKNRILIQSIRRLVACGIEPQEAYAVCDDFIQRFGFRDLNACVRSFEVWWHGMGGI